MASGIAYIALLILLGLNGLATNWFVYGLWPHSWPLFVMFLIFSVVIVAAMQAVTKEK